MLRVMKEAEIVKEEKWALESGWKHIVLLN
jgi:hypothetical protein